MVREPDSDHGYIRWVVTAAPSGRGRPRRAEGSGPVGEARSVTLWARDSLTVAATLTADGALVIKGQDLRAESFFGSGNAEYEYALTVEADGVRRIVEALGGKTGDDVLELLRANGDNLVATGEMTWLRAIGIEPKFWSHLGA
jgi:hypothetical protein